MADIFSIIIASIFVNNYVLGQFLGVCPTIGITNKVETANGMGKAVVVVITLASIITYFVQYKILNPLNLEYLQTIVFILVIATLVQTIETIMKKSMPTLYEALGIYLPLITTNCVVLGVAINNIQAEYNLIQTIFYALGSSLGFYLVLIILSSWRERMDTNDVPESFKGVPIALVTLGLMAICFMGFAGLA